MTVIVLLYRVNLPDGEETRPRHVWANGLPKPPEELLFLLLTEHQFTSGQTLELEHESGLLTPKLLLDLPSHPIEPGGDLLLVSALSPDANPLCHRSSSEEIAVTTTEKLDSSASSPFIVPSAEQPVRGAPLVASRTARNKDCWLYPIEPNMKMKSGLSTPAFCSACSAASRPARLGL